MIDYEFTEIIPEQLHTQIKYTQDGKEFWINARTWDFTEPALRALAESRATEAYYYWERQSAAVASAVNTKSQITGQAKPYVQTPRPEPVSGAPVDDGWTFEWVEEPDCFLMVWKSFTPGEEQ